MMTDEPAPKLSVGMVAAFYGVMLAITLGVAAVLDINVWVWHDRHETSGIFDLLIGASLGIVVVSLSAFLTPRIRWMADLSDAFREFLGEKQLYEVAVFAIASGVVEELLFRGLIQQYLSTVTWFGEPSDLFGWAVATLVFGALHIGTSDAKRFLPWTISSIVLGGVIGGLYLYTGNILAPIVAHFTINFFNLQLICRPEAEID